jgi:16S rRNA (guanine527-N7)-methyltransferase
MCSSFSFINCFKNLIPSLGIVIPDDVLQKLDEYFSLLQKAKEQTNLIGKINLEEICKFLFFDSLLIFKTISLQKDLKIIDLGCGAGFPGLVIKIVCPEIHLTLLDSSNKKINFVKMVGEQLQLDDISFVRERAEVLGRNPLYRETFDIAISKAFAPLEQLVELAAPLIKIGGKIIAWKGISCCEEINILGEGFSKVGLEKPTIHEFSMEEIQLFSVILVFNKLYKTHERFPRSYQAISKRPLSQLK